MDSEVGACQCHSASLRCTIAANAFSRDIETHKSKDFPIEG